MGKLGQFSHRRTTRQRKTFEKLPQPEEKLSNTELIDKLEAAIEELTDVTRSGPYTDGWNNALAAVRNEMIDRLFLPLKEHRV
jgi:hypothetical protein